MQNIWILTVANLRKSKGQVVGMLILMLMTAMFMNIGLSMYFGVGNYYDKRAEELHTAHFATQQNDNILSSARYDFIRQFPGVTEVETQSILHGLGAMFINGERAATPVIIADGTAEQKMNPPQLVGKHLPLELQPSLKGEGSPLEGNAVFIPYGIFLGGGYEIGGVFKLEFAGEQMEFTVAGSTEEIFFGVSPRLYVSSTVFNELQNHFKEQRFTLISARVESGNVETITSDLSERYAKEFANDDGGGFLTLTYPEARASRTINAMVGAMFIIAFSLIVLAIGVIVIRFRINNDIEENMINIGALKAVGYQNKQIILSIVFQFGAIAFSGSVVGVLFSQFIIPMAGGILEPIMGIPWNSEIEILYMVISIIMILLMVVLFSCVSSWRINKLHPLTALRGGTTAKSITRNPLPLEKSHVSLSFLLAMKQLLLNKKQVVALSLIVTGLSFAAVFGITLYYFVNSDALMRSWVLDDMDISAAVNNPAQGAAFRERVLAMPEVISIYGRDEIKLNINDTQITVVIIEDFSSVIINLIDGRFPLYNNEILMGGAAMHKMGVGLGDWVRVGIDGNEEMYLITGMVQTQIDYGLMAVLDIDAFHVIQPDFIFDAFGVVLTKGADGHSFVDKLSEQERGIISETFYLRPFLEVQLSIVGGIFAVIGIALLLTVAAVVTLVLFLVVKTTILRKRRELGIQKALGFTNFQLMNQIALNLLPAALLGVITGTIIGIFTFNPIYLIFLRDNGIVYSNFFIPFDWAVTLCAALILLTYAVSMLVARRIRKISAYTLITE